MCHYRHDSLLGLFHTGSTPVRSLCMYAHMSHASFLGQDHTLANVQSAAALMLDLLRQALGSVSQLKRFMTRHRLCQHHSLRHQAVIANMHSDTVQPFSSLVRPSKHDLSVESWRYISPQERTYLMSQAKHTGVMGIQGVLWREGLPDIDVRCLQGVVWRAGLLTHILQEAMQQEEQPSAVPITAADLSCSLLTRLKDMLHHYSLQGGPRGQCTPTPHCIDSLMIGLPYRANSRILSAGYKLLALPRVGPLAAHIPLRSVVYCTVSAWRPVPVPGLDAAHDAERPAAQG